MNFAGDFDQSTGDETLPLPAVEPGTRTPPGGDTSQSTPHSMPNLTGFDGRGMSPLEQPLQTTYAANTPQYHYGGQPQSGGSAHTAAPSESSRVDVLVEMLIEAQKASIEAQKESTRITAANMAIIERLVATRAEIPPDDQQAASSERMRDKGGPRLDKKDLLTSYPKQSQVLTRNPDAVVYTCDLRPKAVPDKPPSQVVLETTGRFLDVFFFARGALTLEERLCAGGSTFNRS